MTIARLMVLCGMSDSGVRQQLTALVALGLVEELRDGRVVHYRVNLGVVRASDGEA
ncbi:helix-turn-helix domain-containing protein [Paraburkholderia tropica]|uniref:helix-turn-helix domain-containing protein n=1 Tax=Paraburkholderia tropica TaxID=92647 RepID=UPI002AB7AE88|nr:helix-turn-helix domain-containing protein [Paraburkholderia tropica]